MNLLEFLRANGIDARGHDQATGGSVTAEKWNALLERLGFPDVTGR